jgi:hypothetical protein
MSDAPRDLATRMIQVFDTLQADPAAVRRVVDPVTGDIVAQPLEDAKPATDGALDMEELDLSMVAFASDRPLDAVAFMRWVDADGNLKLDVDELETVLACMDDLERRSLAVKLTRLESAREAFAAARPAGTVGKWLAKVGFGGKLQALDADHHAARQDFVETLMGYAGAGSDA